MSQRKAREIVDLDTKTAILYAIADIRHYSVSENGIRDRRSSYAHTLSKILGGSHGGARIHFWAEPSASPVLLVFVRVSANRPMCVLVKMKRDARDSVLPRMYSVRLRVQDDALFDGTVLDAGWWHGSDVVCCRDVSMYKGVPMQGRGMTERWRCLEEVLSKCVSNPHIDAIDIRGATWSGGSVDDMRRRAADKDWGAASLGRELQQLFVWTSERNLWRTQL